jgi:hypothetical protein
MAYFAGAGTVIAAIVGGVGGGLLIADMVSPKPPKQGVETTRLERRMSPQPIQASNAPSPASTNAPSEPVPYLAAPQPTAPNAAVAAVPAQPQTEPENSTSIPAKPTDTAAAAQPAAPTAQPATPAVQVVAREQPAAADNAVAKGRDADVKRVTEKRRAERRLQWTTERRRQPRQDQDLRAVEEKIREETEPRREFAEPVRMERPRILLFGEE